MSKTLIIAEKPSVANDLQRVLGKDPAIGKFKKEKDFFENELYIISSAIGHLVELTKPKAKWNFEAIPILPDKFDIQPIDRSKERLKVLKRLMKNKEVETIINACDAGREGELIFRYIVEIAKCKKPIKRLWMQSMTDSAIKEAFANLRSDEEMSPLADAAVCRSESDWIVGINGTRAMTAFNSRNGGFARTPVGRVQTPTLTILAEREVVIRGFVPRPYFDVSSDFDVAAGEYAGKWFDESFKKDPEDDQKKADRIWSKEEADAIVARCEGKEAVIEEKKKPSKQAPPLLYDLTSLQREASNRHGYSATRTLQLAQGLDEKFKVCTYPRTDSRYLPDDYLSTVKDVMKTFGALDQATGDNAGCFPMDLPKHCNTLISGDKVVPNKRIFDVSKVRDHFAIIPTGQIPKNLDEAHLNVFNMVVRRFLAVFFPSAEFEITNRVTRIGEDAFKSNGKVLKVPGWLEVYGREDNQSANTLVAVEEGEAAKDARPVAEEKETRPPAAYTEATLLSAMESAGKLVDDEEARSAMTDKGLGTPATRASIIEGLIKDKYVVRKERALRCTQRGLYLVEQLGEIGIDLLSSPEMTGEWEHKLKLMEEGQLDRETFMKEIATITSDVVDKAREHAKVAKEKVFPALDLPCPKCGHQPIKQIDRSYRCTECKKFSVQKMIASREMEESEIITLIKSGFVGPLEGFRSRFGQEFEAGLEITKDEHKVGFVFETPEQIERELGELTEENFLCEYEAPDGSKAKVYETSERYIADKAIKAEEPFKKVKLSKTLCKFDIPREQAIKFFVEGSTDYIDKFISKKGRPFTAKLVTDKEGARFMNFQFKPREAKKAAKKGAKKAAKKAAKKVAKKAAAKKAPAEQPAETES